MDNRHFIAKKVASFFRDGDVINLGAGMPVLVGDYITDNAVSYTHLDVYKRQDFS